MKIIVSDFDGTLFDEEFEANISAIKRFTDAGNVFIIATGRAMNSLAEDISMTDIDCEYYICNDGAVIFDKYFNVIFRKDLNPDVVRPIFNMLQDDENILETFIDTSHGYVSDSSANANGIIARPYDKTKATITLGTIVRRFPEVHGYISTNWINIIDHSLNKSKAIQFLIDSYRYNKSDIITVGDGLNDYDMIKDYNGYTLVSGHEDIKAISKGVVSNLSELIDILDHIEKEKEYAEIFADEM